LKVVINLREIDDPDESILKELRKYSFTLPPEKDFFLKDGVYFVPTENCINSDEDYRHPPFEFDTEKDFMALDCEGERFYFFFGKKPEISNVYVKGSIRVENGFN
jgi:hypothetical protein